jgi:hypothetical protein
LTTYGRFGAAELEEKKLAEFFSSSDIMRFAILLYGYFYLDNAVNLWRAPHSKNQLKKYSFVRDGYPGFMEKVYNPIKAISDHVDVYMITHEFVHPRYEMIKNELIDTCKDFTIFFTNQLESPKLPYTYWNLLNKVSSINKYDRYLITRGDLFYKEKITTYFPKYTPRDACWFVFKDYKHTWDEKRIISDIMFLVDNNIDKLKRSIMKHITMHPERTEMHGIYYFLKENFGEHVNSLIEGFYDSNTSKKVKESKNPVYIMIGRSYYFDDRGIVKDKSQEDNILKHTILVPTMAAMAMKMRQSIAVEAPPPKKVLALVPTSIQDTNLKEKVLYINNPQITRFPTKINEVIELYKQRVNEKIQKRNEQRIFLANIIPQKIENIIKEDNKVQIIGLKLFREQTNK